MHEVPSQSPVDLERLAELVANKLDARMSGRPQLVDVVDLAGILGVGEATIRRQKAAGEIPYVSIGSRVLFDPGAVIAARSQNAERPEA